MRIIFTITCDTIGAAAHIENACRKDLHNTAKDISYTTRVEGAKAPTQQPLGLTDHKPVKKPHKTKHKFHNGGRLTDRHRKLIIDLHKDDRTVREICQITKWSTHTVRKVIKAGI